MKDMEQSKVHSGRKVTNPKQTIAIGVSEAREGEATIPKKE